MSRSETEMTEMEGRVSVLLQLSFLALKMKNE